MNAVPRLSDLASAISDADIPPPAEAGFLLPAALLALGAALGGLRVLLQSPLRGSLLGDLDDAVGVRVERALQRHPELGTAVGLTRLFCIAAAVVLFVAATGAQGDLARVTTWVLAALGGGMLLEAIPALVQRRRARRAVLLLLPLARALAVLLRPLTWLIERVLGAIGADRAGHRSRESLTAELVHVAADHEREEELGDAEKRMIARVIELPESDAASAMTPRTELTAVSGDLTLQECLEVAVEEGHSRMPVYGEDLDDVLGVLYVKDLLVHLQRGEESERERVRDLAREPYFVPETMPVLALLDEMRQRRVHLAVVVDEYGGTAGVVTIEDLLEEIVGEIQDEHDEKEEVGQMERIGEHEMLAEGRVALDDLNEFFDVDLPLDEDYDTVAGLLFDRFGHIPEAGESLHENGVVLEVLEADERRIHRVRVAREGPPESASEVA